MPAVAILRSGQTGGDQIDAGDERLARCRRSAAPQIVVDADARESRFQLRQRRIGPSQPVRAELARPSAGNVYDEVRRSGRSTRRPTELSVGNATIATRRELKRQPRKFNQSVTNGKMATKEDH